VARPGLSTERRGPGADATAEEQPAGRDSPASDLLDPAMVMDAVSAVGFGFGAPFLRAHDRIGARVKSFLFVGVYRTERVSSAIVERHWELLDLTMLLGLANHARYHGW